MCKLQKLLLLEVSLGFYLFIEVSYITDVRFAHANKLFELFPGTCAKARPVEKGLKELGWPGWGTSRQYLQKLHENRMKANSKHTLRGNRLRQPGAFYRQEVQARKPEQNATKKCTNIWVHCGWRDVVWVQMKWVCVGWGEFFEHQSSM